MGLLQSVSGESAISASAKPVKVSLFFLIAKTIGLVSQSNLETVVMRVRRYAVMSLG